MYSCFKDDKMGWMGFHFVKLCALKVFRTGLVKMLFTKVVNKCYRIATEVCGTLWTGSSVQKDQFQWQFKRMLWRVKAQGVVLGGDTPGALWPFELLYDDPLRSPHRYIAGLLQTAPKEKQYLNMNYHLSVLEIAKFVTSVSQPR